MLINFEMVLLINMLHTISKKDTLYQEVNSSFIFIPICIQHIIAQLYVENILFKWQEI